MIILRKQHWLNLWKHWSFIEDKFALLMEFVGGIFIYLSTQPGPIGTNNGDLAFGGAKYQFIMSTNPELSKWGLILIILGFFLQFRKGPALWQSFVIPPFVIIFWNILK